MIVRNEEKNLGKVLSDVHGVVDEICIVDTGSADGTIAIAESFGAKIGHFPWCNDFAAARNHSIECAKSDYLLWLDADDRIEEKDRKALLKLKAHLSPARDRAYMLKVQDSTEDTQPSVFHQTRIFPNRPEVRFEGCVHEQILPSLKRNGVKVEPVDITILHTGYHDEQAREEKARRNLEILKEGLGEAKDAATRYFFMAMAAIGLKEYEECMEYMSQARRRRTDEDWLHFSFAVTTECLISLGRTDDAHTEVRRGISLFPQSPLLHLYLGRSCEEAGRLDEAAEAFRKASVLPVKPDSYPSPPDIHTSALVMYAEVLQKAGRTKDAIAAFTKALKSAPEAKSIHQSLGHALLQEKRLEESANHLEAARKLSQTVDEPLWLSLARICEFRKDFRRAHEIYLELLEHQPVNQQALVGLICSSIELNDVDSFLRALEALMLNLGIEPQETEIESLAECAGLCVRVGDRLRQNREAGLSMRMADAALLLDATCRDACLLKADILMDTGVITEAMECLKKALANGAPEHEVLQRVEQARQAL
jgi:tetratricopeptide (TPR) repeat protein